MAQRLRGAGAHRDKNIMALRHYGIMAIRHYGNMIRYQTVITFNYKKQQNDEK